MDFFFLQSIVISLYHPVSIDKLAFIGLPNLDTLRIHSTELSSPPPLDGIRQNLTTLKLKSNKLTSFPSAYFSGCDKLRVLVLSSNHLRTLPNVSSISDTLGLLDVNNNYLNDIGSLEDLVFSNLQYLILNDNQIQHVNITRLHLPQLHQLDLTTNSLQELGHPKWLVLDGERAEGHHDIPAKLNLAGNPWNCTASLSWIALSIQKWKYNAGTVDLFWVGSPVLVENAQAMICELPPHMRGKPALCVGRYLHP